MYPLFYPAYHPYGYHPPPPFIPTWEGPCRCFSPGGSHQQVNLYACSHSQMVMQERHRDLSWFGQEKALHPAGGGDVFYYLAPKCLYRGEYRRALLRMVMYGWLFYVWSSSYSFLSLPFYSSKGRPRSHVVGNKIRLDRGVVR